eukprot:gene1897-2074_t
MWKNTPLSIRPIHNSLRCVRRWSHDKSLVDSIIRNTQATENFRSSFLDASSSSVRISTMDLDDLVVCQHCRPSALIGLYGVAGGVLGMTARLLPSAYGAVISQVVQEVATQQLNDNIRDMQSVDQGGYEDVKETIKYHRDVSVHHHSDDSQQTSTSQDGNTAGPTATTTDPVLTVVSNGLGTLLKVSRDV